MKCGDQILIDIPEGALRSDVKKVQTRGTIVMVIHPHDVLTYWAVNAFNGPRKLIGKPSNRPRLIVATETGTFVWVPGHFFRYCALL